MSLDKTAAALASNQSALAREILYDNFCRPSDVKVYWLTPYGHEQFQQGLPLSQMQEGVHYKLMCTIPYRRTPIEILDPTIGQDKNNFYRYESRSKGGKKGGKEIHRHRQIPLRVKTEK